MTIGSGYYTVTVAAPPPAAGAQPTFTITAAPVAGKGQDKDSQCVSFSVTNTGKQSSVNSSGTDTTASCW
jgi:Tfp pilus assembly protein PilE